MNRPSDEALLCAYRTARYEVSEGPGWALFVDQPSRPLAALMSRHGAICAAYLTAYNPRSLLRSDAANRQADQQLQQRLRLGGWNTLRGRALAPDGSWPPEESHLVLGISMQDALALAREFSQRAVLWCAADAIPRLVEC